MVATVQTDDVKALCNKNNTDLVVVPSEMTSVLQHLDVSVNKLFKANLRAEYEEWIRECDRELTPTSKIRKVTPETIAQWVSNAWKGIRPEMVENSFKKCGISNALDGTEDDTLWEADSAGDSDSNSVFSISSDSDE